MNSKVILSVWVIMLLVTAPQIQAENKVVVIPMAGDEAPAYKTIFLTQESWMGELGGPTGADDKCQNEADNLPGSKVKGKRFKAWISGGLAKDFTSGRTFNQPNLPYKLVDDRIVANDYADLVSGDALNTGIDVYADGTRELDNTTRVWTGILDTGDFDTNDCQLWASSSPGHWGLDGEIIPQGSTWTEKNNTICSIPHKLYCFEQ